jgi:hypothetical protein
MLIQLLSLHTSNMGEKRVCSCGCYIKILEPHVAVAARLNDHRNASGEVWIIHVGNRPQP